MNNPAAAGELKALRWLATEWASGLCEAWSGVTSSSGKVADPQEEVIAEEIQYKWRMDFDLTDSCSVWIADIGESGEEIGRLSLEALGVERPDAGEVKSTLMELLSQAASSLASAISVRLGREIKCTMFADAVQPPAETPTLPVGVQLGPSYCARFAAAATAPLLAAIDVEASLSPALAPGSSDERSDECRQLPFRSILDIELPIHVPLGRGSLSVKELLTLREGSTVRLQSDPGGPFDINFDGTCLAGGHIVAFKGEYAIRVEAVSSLKERLQQISQGSERPGKSSQRRS